MAAGVEGKGVAMFGVRKMLQAAKVVRQHRETMKAFEDRIAFCRERHQAIRHIEAERSDYMHALLAKRGQAVVG